MSGYLAVLGGPRDVHARGAVAAAAALAARSPDGMAGWSSGSATLVQGHLRLYPEHAATPAVASLEGTHLVGDVRIDARDELRAALRRELGPGCRPASDVELVLHAHRAWGEECVRRLQGDFSFLLWSEPRQEAFFAVDHFAVRPLFHLALAGGGVAVSNTMGALHALDAGMEVDELAVADHLLFGMSMEAERTLFSAIRRLPRAHRGSWSEREGVRTRPYWTLDAQPELRLRDGREYVEAFRGMLGSAIRDRLRGTPVSIEMSGGLDSPLLAGMAKRELEASGVADGVRAWCFSHAAAFADPEPASARAVARHLGIPLRVFDGGPVPALDPAAATRAVPLQPLAPISHAVAAEMLGHSRIALSGFDGDALFKVSFQRMWRGMAERGAVGSVMRSALALAPVALHNRRFPRLGLRSVVRRRVRPRPAPELPGWLREDFVARLGLRERVAALRAPQASAGDDPRAEARGQLQTAIWTDLFESYDAGSTGLPHVVMHPLMDLRVVTFLQGLPPIPWCVEKYLLRRAGAGMLPPETLRRVKTPLAGDPLQARSAEVVAALSAPGALNAVERWIAPEKLELLDVAAGETLSWEVARLASLARWLRQERAEVAAGPLSVTLKGTSDVPARAEAALQGS